MAEVQFTMRVGLPSRSKVLGLIPLTTQREEASSISTINKNLEAEIGIQPEGQKSKAASHWLSPLPQSKMAILPPGILIVRL